jgi:hypothetical protein
LSIIPIYYHPGTHFYRVISSHYGIPQPVSILTNLILIANINANFIGCIFLTSVYFKSQKTILREGKRRDKIKFKVHLILPGFNS